nr:hypothetical protein [Lysobacter solisilvae]
MRTYLRTRAPGGLYFFTLVLANRCDDPFLIRRIETLRHAFRKTRAERPFTVEAIVVLPDHLHCLWRLPEGDADYATRWRLIKSRVSRAIAPRRSPVGEPEAQGRARHLAAAVLGAFDSGCGRFPEPP